MRLSKRVIEKKLSVANKIFPPWAPFSSNHEYDKLEHVSLSN